MKTLLNKWILTISLVLVTWLAFGQNTGVDQRLVDMYGQERIAQMQSEQPQLIDYLDFYVRNAYRIIYDLPPEKIEQFEDISVVYNTRTGEAVSEDDIYDLNILELSIKRRPDEHLTYRVGNSGIVVVFVAPDVVKMEYEESKNGNR